MAAPEYWLWLYRTLGFSVRANDLVLYYGSAENVYQAGKADWIRTGLADRETIEKLSVYSPSQSYSMMKTCEKNGWEIITPDSEYYPPQLKKTADFPLVLFADGNIEFLKKQPSVAIVGTRTARDKARVCAYRLAMYLSCAGVCIVSGGAMGIDSCAHEGAILASGGSVAVLGCGLGCGYLSSLKSLRERIKENGVLISENEPFSDPTRYTFPRRNRIISGMCTGTAVVEASLRSGSLITANCASLQHRELFAVAPEIVKSSGCQKLLEEGARPIYTAMDVVSEYAPSLPDKEGSCYLSLPLKNDGISGKSILRPESMSREEYENYYKISGLYRSPENAPEAVFAEPDRAETHEKTRPVQKTRQAKAEKAAEHQINPSVAASLSPEAAAVYAALTEEEMLLDDIGEKVKLEASQILCAVTELELEDMAQLHFGNRISRKTPA